MNFAKWKLHANHLMLAKSNAVDSFLEQNKLLVPAE